MDTNQLVIILLFIIIITLILVISFIIFQYIKFKPDIISEVSKDKDLSRSNLSKSGICYIHKLKHSSGLCSICEQEICSECVKQVDNINLCPAHLNTYIENRWTAITNQITTPDSPEDGVYIYKFKQKIWKQNHTPSYIVNDYKINIENDHIETYVKLYVREIDREILSKGISSDL